MNGSFLKVAISSDVMLPFTVPCLVPLCGLLSLTPTEAMHLRGWRVND